LVPTQRYSVARFTPSSAASACMSIRSPAMNFARARRKASSGPGAEPFDSPRRRC
jgi:hypothetical protein